MDRLRQMELIALKKEEQVIRELLKKYEKALIRLQVEDLTIMHQLVGKEDQELKLRNTTVLEADVNSYQQIQTNQLQMLPVTVSNSTGQSEITMKELQINQSTLNLDAAPLIHRMLQDSEAYEEEEEEEEAEEQ
ncbi:uncharacterized protein LOC125036481 [Penaeus chinensis]|uniref:uncharacterized protein LOC125036481 n=1 Tax=Penaeus chinensis TaxID=139456 RepID=UPI001FB677BC|nr:uncharacterized protein LOC125036481 [Penaeus chinensis]XP_047485048.1 uncharacterized protein LOC125036481 [Penaeus chinensis]XP_047485049.1 uncharacterized protein LOC125036481 [Penaeus chinensis]XP_047485050.1 uncharacterized protein LOC125036481 [Penaeus chinensis]XP_047485052.1 uncharacterized protein LOC125036481 [Penaeus chinensis]